MAMSTTGENREIILITGGSGLIGRAISRQLVKKYKVISLDVKPIEPSLSEASENEVIFVKTDISSKESIQNSLEKVRTTYGDKISSVVHLAAYYSFSGKPDSRFSTITVEGTKNLVKALKKFKVDQFIFSSTMLIHAPARDNQRINETTPLLPRWSYPQSKVEAEKVIAELHEDTPVVNLRIAGVYDDTCHSIPLAQQIKRIYEKQLTSHVFPGNRSHGQAFVHIDDLVDAVEVTIERRFALPMNLSLLIGEPKTLSFKELQDEIGQCIYGTDWGTLRIPKTVAKLGAWIQEKIPYFEDPFIKPWMIHFADDQYALDIHLARKTLDWYPRKSLRMTLPKMIDELKNNPRNWYQENKLEYPTRFEAFWIRNKNVIYSLASVGAISWLSYRLLESFDSSQNRNQKVKMSEPKWLRKVS